MQETVTVTGEAPLVDTTGSTVGANIDPRQMQELPINGRNWMDLTLLAPGARRNEGGGMAQFRQGYAQTNVDGQQVTINYHSQTDSEQPGFSRDAIAEFEVVANRFDATQGRSQGMIVNAITKSGTNQFAGHVRRLLPDDKFNAKDFITHRVLPYSNQQVSTTLGGPIRRDRIHFFGAYEFEREPKTYTFTSPYPFFNIDQEFPTQVAHSAGTARLSVHAAEPAQRARVAYHNDLLCAAAARRSHPSVSGTRKRRRRKYDAHLHAGAQQPVGQRNQSRRHQLRAAGSAVVRWKGGRLPVSPGAAREFDRSSSCRATRSARTRSTSSRTRRPFATTITTTYDGAAGTT